MGRIRVGISSWTEPTLIKSGWYPSDATTAEDRLRYYASKFPIVEVDSTFYAIPNAKTAQLWVERTPRDFTFNAKAHALLTQHPTPPARLPKDLREKLGDSKGNLYFKDLAPKDKESVWDRFREGLQPLQDAGKLGAIVFQFPKWFLPSPASYRFLEDHAYTYVVVDEPQGFSSSVPPVVAVTAPRGMVRFHGRNRETWEKKGISTAEKFRYLYQPSELKPWVRNLGDMAKEAKEVHAIFNNCYS